jgi:GH18 family chitinase
MLHPLYRNVQNITPCNFIQDYTIKHLIKSGASSDKIVVGIPTYGRSYTLFNEDANALGSPADGPGTEGDATREKGYLAYYEVCPYIISLTVPLS